ncbi:MAG: hypothetical protein AUK63_2007 [bacterium P3]|nr:MAG: hypothetical protein AUK63_2007 [bacterium P3]
MDAVVVIDVPVQIDPAGDDMEVLDAAGAVLVEHHEILAILEVRGFRAFPLGHLGEIHCVEGLDEVVGELDPLIHRPPSRLRFAGGDLDPDGGVLQGTVGVQLPPEFELGSLHQLPHGRRVQVLRNLVQLDELGLPLFG